MSDRLAELDDYLVSQIKEAKRSVAAYEESLARCKDLLAGLEGSLVELRRVRATTTRNSPPPA